MAQNTSTTNQNQATNQVANTSQQQQGTSTTTRSPYAPLIPYLDTALGQAGAIYGMSSPYADVGDPGNNIPAGSPFTSVPNSWVNAGLLQNASWANTLKDSGAATSPYFTALNRYNSPIDTETQGLLNKYHDVYSTAQNNLGGLAGDLSGALTPTQQAILDQNAERISNRQASLYSGAGRYGSFGSGIGMARGISETNNPLIAQFNQSNIQNALNANAQMAGTQLGAAGGAGGLYNTAQARAQQYGGMLPGFAQLGLAPGEMLQQGGNYLLSYPWQTLNNSVKSLSGLVPLYGNAGSQTTDFSGSSSGITNTTGNTTGTSETSRATPWTTFAGLGLAGLGALSDRRAKTDIKRVGKDPWTSLDMYEWRYKGQPKDTEKYVGPMAQDVAKVAPEKVGTAGGLLYIKA